MGVAMVDEIYMHSALEQARHAYQCGEVPVGAVVVLEGKIIATGYNQPVASHDPSAHAEVIALRKAGQRLGNYRLLQSELYVTLEPCAMCFATAVHARIARLVYGASDPRTGTCGGVVDLRKSEIFNHVFAVTGGVLAGECGKLLQDFFATRR